MRRLNEKKEKKIEKCITPIKRNNNNTTTHLKVIMKSNNIAMTTRYPFKNCYLIADLDYT